MLPRKRLRPNPAAASSLSLPPTAAVASPETSLSRVSSGSEQAGGHRQKKTPSTPANCQSQQVRKTHSWYGSWPRAPKASASTSVAKENILGGTVKSKGKPDLSRFEPKKTDDDASLQSTMGKSPAPHKGSESSLNRPPATENTDDDEAPRDDHVHPSTELKPAPEPDSVPKPPPALEPPSIPESHPGPTPCKGDETASGGPPQTPTTPRRQAAASGWLGWWSKAPSTETAHTSTPAPASAPEPTTEPTTELTTELTPQPSKQEEDVVAPSTPPEQTAPSLPPTEAPANESTSNAPPSASWFGFWYSTPQAKMKPTSQEPECPKESTPVKEPDSREPSPPKDTHKPEPDLKKEVDDVAIRNDTPPPAQEPSPPPKPGSTWAFWSKDSPKNKGKATVPEAGEIAVMGEGSEAQPKPMTESDVSDSRAKDIKDDSGAKEVQPTSKSGWRRSKRLRPLSMDVDVQRPSSAGSTKTLPVQSPTTKSPQAAEQALPPAKPQAKPRAKSSAKMESAKTSTPESDASAKQPPNLLLPSFSSTYQMKENASILRQITNLVLRTSHPPPNHVFRVKDPPKIRKAVAIGVHGLFPAAYLRPMIGQPTGTSLRFVNLCADSIRRWVDSHGSPECVIEKVALEGEGTINERVENLWRLMLNWVDHIREADLVMIACHSQGVPVSIMLLEKLIDLGIVAHNRIGVCAMAGVALGPFPNLKSSILMGSAAELWEFGNPQSNNSNRFEACLKRVLDHGARITFIGSIDDQLVPMESAVYSPANHLYLYRAVFIDGRVHAPDFIAHLVGFALKLRNLGISDHGLIRELSAALAGSLYSGEGHSRLYYDAAVYDLAVAHALETTNTAQPTPCVIPNRETTALGSANPYVLPWIMRGILEENFVKTQLSAETDELLRQFDDWKPTNKALKDVKYRLEAVRSKL